MFMWQGSKVQPATPTCQIPFACCCAALPAYFQADVKALEAVFARASKENWDTKHWIKASRSRSDVSKWRRLLTWPFGEEGGVFRFNKAGDGLYIITSTGR